MRNHPKMQTSVTTYPSTPLWLGERIEPLTCKHSVLFLLPWFCPVGDFRLFHFHFQFLFISYQKKKIERLLSGPQSPAGEWRQLIKNNPPFLPAWWVKAEWIKQIWTKPTMVYERSSCEFGIRAENTLEPLPEEERKGVSLPPPFFFFKDQTT